MTLLALTALACGGGGPPPDPIAGPVDGYDCGGTLEAAGFAGTAALGPQNFWYCRGFGNGHSAHFEMDWIGASNPYAWSSLFFATGVEEQAPESGRTFTLLSNRPNCAGSPEVEFSLTRTNESPTNCANTTCGIVRDLGSMTLVYSSMEVGSVVRVKIGGALACGFSASMPLHADFWFRITEQSPF